MTDAVTVPEVLQQIGELEARYHVERLIPQVLDLVVEVDKALRDGQLSVGEMWRIGTKFVKLVVAARKAS